MPVGVPVIVKLNRLVESDEYRSSNQAEDANTYIFIHGGYFVLTNQFSTETTAREQPRGVNGHAASGSRLDSQPYTEILGLKCVVTEDRNPIKVLELPSR